MSCFILLVQAFLSAWRKHRCDASFANIKLKSENRTYTGPFPKLSKFADEHGGWLIFACKVERFLGSAGLLGLSLYDLIIACQSRNFEGGISLESANFSLLGLVATYVSCLSTNRWSILIVYSSGIPAFLLLSPSFQMLGPKQPYGTLILCSSPPLRLIPIGISGHWRHTMNSLSTSSGLCSMLSCHY